MENTLKPSLDLVQVEIKPLDEKISRAAFHCGNTKIDNFCINNAKKQHKENRIRCYDALYGDELIGYYYLVASAKDPEELSVVANKKFGRVSSAPAVYLGMIGVSEQYARNGVGKLLMLDAMRVTLEVAKHIGLYALVLDAVDQDTAGFYEKLGFEYFTKGELSMFIPINTIKEALKI